MAVSKIVIAARLRPSTFEKINNIAEEKEMSVSELIRFIVENYVNSR